MSASKVKRGCKFVVSCECWIVCDVVKNNQDLAHRFELLFFHGIGYLLLTFDDQIEFLVVVVVHEAVFFVWFIFKVSAMYSFTGS